MEGFAQMAYTTMPSQIELGSNEQSGLCGMSARWFLTLLLYLYLGVVMFSFYFFFSFSRDTVGKLY